ncbi:Uncharacterized protein OBRU01_02735 [Operophtera brumata]|uniref:Uncharacterized protein n=1 Tax=Operophtera brumata TaxID=104452 RepID=A0A0L7LPW7_OPEBR|nr:Uncharacterized protein OBRU01_02735 [Operophtera brumata]
MSQSQDKFSSFSLQKSEVNPGHDSATSYEVFRNNTTAVEVVVKDVFKGKKRATPSDQKDKTLYRLEADIERLTSQLENANITLAKTRQGFQTIIRAMKKQIVTVNVRESDKQAENLSLKLENEKLRIILDSKTKLLSRMKKEITTMKRVLKFVIKSVCSTPEIPVPVNTIDSDQEYENFKTDMKKNVRVKFLDQDFTETFDSTISKDYVFDKKL